MRDPSVRSYPRQFKSLVPRRRFDRRAALGAMLVISVLLGICLWLDNERRQAIKMRDLFSRQLSERCEPPFNERDRVVAWREANGRVHCQNMISIETVIDKGRR